MLDIHSIVEERERRYREVSIEFEFVEDMKKLNTKGKTNGDSNLFTDVWLIIWDLLN